MIDQLHQLMNMCRCQIIRFLVGVFLSCTLTHAVAQIDTHTEEAPYLYTVKSGDTLSLISQKYLLDGALIYLLQANTGINKNEK